MASDLNPGYKNNINVIEIRSTGSSLQRLTDRAIDIDGDGDKEMVTTVTVPTGVGSKVRETNTIPAGSARTVIETVIETDGGVNNDAQHTHEYTTGVS